MGVNGLDEYWIPEHVKDYLRKLGFVLPLDDMEPWDKDDGQLYLVDAFNEELPSISYSYIRF